MKNRKIIFDYSSSNKTYFRENRFVFLDENLGDKLKASASNLLDAATKLVTLTTDIIGKAVGLVEKGIAFGESGVRKASEWIESPGKPENLSEYSEMDNVSSPNYIPPATSTGDRKMDAALEGYRRMSFLEIKIRELTAFNQPFLSEFQKVEAMRKEIYNKNKQLGEKFTQLNRDVSRTEAALNANALLPNDPRRVKLVSDLAMYREARDKMEADLSYVIDWDKPQIQPTEYPRGSGIPCDRFLPSAGLKVKLSIRDLYDWMESNGETRHAVLIKKYEKEMEKLDYYSQKLSNSVTLMNQTKGLVEKNKIKAKSDEIKAGIAPSKFKKIGAPRNATGLEVTDPVKVKGKSAKDRKALIDSL